MIASSASMSRRLIFGLIPSTPSSVSMTLPRSIMLRISSERFTATPCRSSCRFAYNRNYIPCALACQPAMWGCGDVGMWCGRSPHLARADATRRVVVWLRVQCCPRVVRVLVRDEVLGPVEVQCVHNVTDLPVHEVSGHMCELGLVAQPHIAAEEVDVRAGVAGWERAHGCGDAVRGRRARDLRELTLPPRPAVTT